MLSTTIDLRIRSRFTNLKNGHRSEVQMSDVEIEHGFEDWTSIRGWTLI